MKLQIPFFALIASFAMISCGGEKDETEEVTQNVDENIEETLDNEASDMNEIAEFKFHVFLANIPSPLETMVQLPNNGMTFNKDLVLSTDQTDQFSTLAKKAVAYGIYGTDLGYVTVYEDGDLTTDYFTTTRLLAEELGAGDEFNRSVADRFKKNAGNRDSLLVLMDEAIGQSEEYLKNNQRLELASLMLAGAWVESQYILLYTLLGKSPSDAPNLFAKLPEQKNHLKNMMDVMREQTGSSEAAAMVKTLQPLAKLYGSIESSSIDNATVQTLFDNVKSVREQMSK